MNERTDEEIDILSLNYDVRRVIVIAPQSQYDHEESQLDWTTFAADAFVGGLLAPFTILGDVVSLVRKYSKKNAPRMLLVPASVAQAQLHFPPGHPALDTAYVGHPLIPRSYAPLATFHHRVFEQKVNELVTLLASLGAEHVKVRHRKGYKKGAGLTLGIDTPISPNAAASGACQREGAQHASFEETYEPSRAPRVPDNLVWYPTEPSWQALAQRRLAFKTRTFKANLTYSDSFGIDGRLKGGLESIGVRAGGNFTDFRETIWDFEGTFADFDVED